MLHVINKIERPATARKLNVLLEKFQSPLRLG
jgi:hypothetical protein